ncbi:MAG: Uma2 family endonuclease, partial [Bacteroidota bacterium]
MTLLIPPAPTVSYEAFRAQEAADPNHIYELLDGQLVKKTSPSPRHQYASNQISYALTTFVMVENELGTVFTAPLDVFFDEQNAIKPDIIYISLHNEEIITEDGIVGVPDLIVEIV